ncbi:MAG: type VI secretion system lipoprotein TssJ [Desulfobacteraceae bacterium]|nr:type VI secretion system lipoprotein TssJ [Desulfobacteraceae bacterium]
MTRFILTIIKVFCILCLLQACSFKPVAPAQWNYGENAIEIKIKVDQNLNEDRGKAYTLYFVVYQLSDPDRFNQLGEDVEGLGTLLESQVFDPSVKSVKSMIIYPGSDVTYKIDRSQHAQYVGIVAGYNVLTKARIQRLYKIKTKVGKVRTEKKMIPQKLTINLYLSPTQIEAVK